MMKYIVLFFLVMSLSSCNAKDKPQVFSEAALNDTFIALDGTTVTFQSILNKHKGKTILIDIWASWCGDCVKGMPIVKAIQNNHKDVVYLFLSLDKGVDRWKKGIDKYNVNGQHYYMQSGWEGAFGSFVDLDWIPRYMVVDANQKITLFKATKASDTNINKSLTK